MFRRLWLLGPILLLALAIGFAQQAQKPETVVRVTTRLVQVNVVVHDKKGQPVSDLTKDDFVVLDEGQEQQIRFFSVESVLAPKQEPAPLPANTWSNGIDRQPGVPNSLTVILFDTLNTRTKDQPYARAQMVKFLKQLQPQDRIAIYSLGNGLKVLHDFTRDSESLVRAISRYGTHINTEVEASTAELADTGDEELDAIMNAANERMANFYLERRVETTLQALTAIAGHLAGLPGRKNLIWVSGGFPFNYGMDLLAEGNINADVKLFNQEIGRASQAVNNGNIAIYPVDARGLVGTADIMPSLSASSATRRPQVMAAGDRRAQAQFRATLDTMKDIAERTGGRAFYNTNDIMGSVRRAIDDSRVTYVLAFYPRQEGWDGRFHKLKVRVKRPGVEVRFRQGFYTLPEEAMNDKQRETATLNVLRSPLEASTLGLTVRLITAPAGGHAASPARLPSDPVRFEMIVDPRQLTLSRQGDRLKGSIYFVFEQKKADGRSLKLKSEIVQLNFTEARYQEMIAGGMAVSAEWQVEPEAEQMRVVIFDGSSAALGSLTFPLKR